MEPSKKSKVSFGSFSAEPNMTDRRSNEAGLIPRGLLRGASFIFKFLPTTLIGAILFLLPGQIGADVVNNDIFLQGTYIEIGMAAQGWFGSGENAPGGYHPIGRATLGFVADYGKDGWGVAAPGEQNQSGDYFLPGGPVQGFEVSWEVGGVEREAKNINGLGNDIATNVTRAETSAGATQSMTWSGEAVNGGEKLKVERNISFDVNDTYFVIEVTLTNTGAGTLESVEFLEVVDPDNDQDYSGSFDTINTIDFQPGANPENKALVSATGATFTNMYLGLATVDSRARVAYGAISLDADDIIAANMAEGDTNTSDTRIGLAFRFGNLAPGASITFKYGYILVKSDIDNFLAGFTPPASGGIDISGGGGAGGGCFVSNVSD